MERYKSDVEKLMAGFYNNLSEKDKRHYSAIEAIKLGHGGVKYIASLFKCSRQTIYTGIHELHENTLLSQGKIRRLGGGRKQYDIKYSKADKIFLKCN
jgi:predicted transcriptional regulator